MLRCVSDPTMSVMGALHNYVDVHAKRYLHTYLALLIKFGMEMDCILGKDVV